MGERGLGRSVLADGLWDGGLCRRERRERREGGSSKRRSKAACMDRGEEGGIILTLGLTPRASPGGKVQACGPGALRPGFCRPSWSLVCQGAPGVLSKLQAVLPIMQSRNAVRPCLQYSCPGPSGSGELDFSCPRPSLCVGSGEAWTQVESLRPLGSPHMGSAPRNPAM